MQEEIRIGKQWDTVEDIIFLSGNLLSRLATPQKQQQLSCCFYGYIFCGKDRRLGNCTDPHILLPFPINRIPFPGSQLQTMAVDQYSLIFSQFDHFCEIRHFFRLTQSTCMGKWLSLYLPISNRL
ncbi:MULTISPECIES: hypothetical protein [Chitinophagaceae]